MTDSRIPGLYRLDTRHRIQELERRGILGPEDAESLRSGHHVLLPRAADKMIENVLGVFGLPFAIAPNFIVNGQDYLVPMVVEEPSIVAGLSYGAGLARTSGGFRSQCDESLLVGQIHLENVGDIDSVNGKLEAARARLLAAANEVHPRLTKRGGGVRDIEVRQLEMPNGDSTVAVHLLVDTCDAMGANLVNTICERVAPQVAEACGGEVAMCILSNLADRSLVTAEVRYGCEVLATQELQGEQVRDAIVTASNIAAADPYRAATHNKGIMNGIDAVAIATGNDWRAIEAGAHAYAAVDGLYGPLSSWETGEDGELVGRIRLPLKVGTVGGTLAVNPAAALGLRITGVKAAPELAQLMAAVGLAQNFAALRALATTGIQRGHMRLHARSVVAAAGIGGDRFEDVVEQLVETGDVKAERAREIAAGLGSTRADSASDTGKASGKIILLGEHAVVYGKHALALPIPDAVSAVVRKGKAMGEIVISDWGLRCDLDDHDAGIAEAVRLIFCELDIARRDFDIVVRSSLPRAMGLGSSAAVAVAIVRALDRSLALGLDDRRVNEVAFECEKLAHGTPSGVDNTVATYSRPILFRSGEALVVDEIDLATAPPLVIASGDQSGATHRQVAGVRERHRRSPGVYDAIFAQIDTLSVEGAALLQREEYEALGGLMNVCQGLLNAIEVSTPELERMISIARSAGAVGAKLTGAGGGGSVVALCPGTVAPVTRALRAAGYDTLQLDHDREAV